MNFLYFVVSAVHAVVIQGCASDAGKSILVTALRRILARRGLRMAPFNPQNMALNSAVTVDGGEIGRAQALQAIAAGVPPHIDFNPILLKPSTDKRSQVIIHGKAHSALNARDYHEYKPHAMKAVLESWQRLCAGYDCIVVEGAGSPAEINLRATCARDIANMSFAKGTDCPVILIANIDRGDFSLLEPGLRWLEQRTGKPVLGVLPYLHGLYLDAEDAVPRQKETKYGTRLEVIAPAHPRISNHNDLDPLRFHPDVDFTIFGPYGPVPDCDLIVLPGSKAVQSDLDWLREMCWDEAIRRHLRYDGKVIGICGGLQMLGTKLHDPLGLEGQPGSAPGLGLLDFETTLSNEKNLENVTGKLDLPGNAPLKGYRIHMGVSNGPVFDFLATWLDGDDGALPEGAISPDNQVLATYCHGLFDTPEALSALLEWAGHKALVRFDPIARRERDIDRLADAVEEHLDLEKLSQWLPFAEKRTPEV